MRSTARHNTLPLLLLDRDGTLIEDRVYLRDPKKVMLCPRVLAGLKRLQAAGFPWVVISNQSGVARKLMTLRDVRRVNARVRDVLAKKKIRLDRFYFCPHLPDTHCGCRKPALELVRRAARDLGRPWRGAISVGDKWSDVLVGQRAGGYGVLVLTGEGRKSARHRPRGVRADYVAANFETAARWIVRAVRKERLDDKKA